MAASILDIVTSHLDSFVDLSVDRVLAAQIPMYTGLPRDLLRGSIALAFRAAFTDLRNHTVDTFPAYLRQVSLPRIAQGGLGTDILKGFNIGFEVVTEYMAAHHSDDHALLLEWEKFRSSLVFAGSLLLAEETVAVRDEYIGSQATQIMALSTPLIPVYNGVLAVPLIGSLDAARITQIMENVLEGIVRYQAETIIIDITGVPVVDAVVAQSLLHVAQAAKLLGAQLLLVGIRPEIAQLIVQLDNDWSSIITLATFQAGIERALALQGRMIAQS